MSSRPALVSHSLIDTILDNDWDKDPYVYAWYNGSDPNALIPAVSHCSDVLSLRLQIKFYRHRAVIKRATRTQG